jgi:hypothetical protein
VLVTGDITDAGRSAEWAEFFAALAPLLASQRAAKGLQAGRRGDRGVQKKFDDRVADIP